MCHTAYVAPVPFLMLPYSLYTLVDCHKPSVFTRTCNNVCEVLLATQLFLCKERMRERMYCNCIEVSIAHSCYKIRYASNVTKPSWFEVHYTLWPTLCYFAFDPTNDVFGFTIASNAYSFIFFCCLKILFHILSP